MPFTPLRPWSRLFRPTSAKSPLEDPPPGPSPPREAAAGDAPAATPVPAPPPPDVAVIDDPAELARLAVEGSTSRVRQQAAQRVADPQTLKRLSKQMRDKDKNVYRTVKQKLDALRAEEARAARLDAERQTLCAALERHAQRVHEPLYETSLKLFEAQWRTLDTDTPPALRLRILEAIERCRAAVAARTQAAAAEAAAAAAEAQAAGLRAAAQAARQEQAAAADAEADRRRAAAALEAEEAARRRAVEDAARAAEAAAEHDLRGRIAALVGKARAAVRAGDTGRAARLRQALDARLAAAPVLPAGLTSQIKQLDEQLDELRAWKDYAVAPKRAQLIAAMKALEGVPLAPPVVAERIKRLQEQWKTISKGVVTDSEADWVRFHEAAQAAYRPCREYFLAQAEVRRINFEHRALILERLRALESAPRDTAADWRLIARAVREAPLEWRRHVPVERTAGREQRQAFAAQLERLQTHLDHWHAANRSAKESLIERARRLSDVNDTRAAVADAKLLQQEWKRVGAAAPDAEESLWGAFRAQCDQVFARRDQAHAEHAARLEAGKARAIALCEAVEAAARLEGAAFDAAHAQLAQWREAASGTFGDLPRDDARALQERFERAVKRCGAVAAQARAAAAEGAVRALIEAAARIQAFGRAVAADAAPSVREALKGAAAEFIARTTEWPRGAPGALEAAWTAAHGARADRFAAHAAELRLLCVRAELRAGWPTPKEDEALRREFQLQRLVRRMGQRDPGDAEDLDALALQWARTGCVAETVYAALEARFMRCRTAPPATHDGQPRVA